MHKSVQELIDTYSKGCEAGSPAVHLAMPGDASLRSGLHMFTTVCGAYVQLEMLPDDLQVPQGGYCPDCLQDVTYAVSVEDALDVLQDIPSRYSMYDDIKQYWRCWMEGRPGVHLAIKDRSDPPEGVQYFVTIAGEQGEGVVLPKEYAVAEDDYCADCWRELKKQSGDKTWRPNPKYL